MKQSLDTKDSLNLDLTASLDQSSLVLGISLPVSPPRELIDLHQVKNPETRNKYRLGHRYVGGGDTLYTSMDSDPATQTQQQSVRSLAHFATNTSTKTLTESDYKYLRGSEHKPE